MKTLDVNAMGLQEMNRSEMIETEGGLLPIVWFLIGVAVAEVLDRDAPSDFMEGYNDARKK